MTDQKTPQPDRGDATPPHGDELRSEHSFGRTDRYTNADDPEAERPVLSDETLGQGDTRDAAEREHRFEQIDDAAERDARDQVRRRERRGGQ